MRRKRSNPGGGWLKYALIAGGGYLLFRMLKSRNGIADGEYGGLPIPSEPAGPGIQPRVPVAPLFWKQTIQKVSRLTPSYAVRKSVQEQPVQAPKAAPVSVQESAILPTIPVPQVIPTEWSSVYQVEAPATKQPPAAAKTEVKMPDTKWRVLAQEEIDRRQTDLELEGIKLKTERTRAEDKFLQELKQLEDESRETAELEAIKRSVEDDVKRRSGRAPSSEEIRSREELAKIKTGVELQAKIKRLEDAFMAADKLRDTQEAAHDKKLLNLQLEIANAPKLSTPKRTYAFGR